MFRFCCCLLTLLLVLPSGLKAHGSVTADADLCIIRVGFYSAHFKVYQPTRSAHREFCEDLPARGETLFVMEYLHQTLSEVPMEFRILRNPTGLGRFTRLEDLPSDPAVLDELTVLQHRVDLAPDVLTVRHVFAEAGDYVGLVQAQDPNTEQQYLAVFPFEVDGSVLGWAPVALLGALLLAQGCFWWSRGRLPLRRGSQQALLGLALLLLVVVPPQRLQAAQASVSGSESATQVPAAWVESRDGAYRVRLQPDVAPLPLNSMHGWTLLLHDAAGQPVIGARLQLSGGMPAHNHGLPSAPGVQALPEPGRYRVEGLRFHMPGDWELQLAITHQGRETLVLLPVRL